MIKIVVCDLDNTVYDWVSYYVPAFDALIAELERSAGVDERALLASFQRAHQAHGTSEYAFVLSELDVLRDAEALAARSGGLHPAIAAFRREARLRLRLYPGVRETLRALRAQHRTVAAYTDAMTAYADARIAQLGLTDLVDELIATADHPVPPGALDSLSYFPIAQFSQRSAVKHMELPGHLRKPNPEALLALLDRYDAHPEEAMYVGDSLTRDISMAQAGGLHDVYAAYGRSYSPDLWARLVRVTHWTNEDVQREQRLAETPITPTHTVSSFSELLGLVRTLDGFPSRAPMLG